MLYKVFDSQRSFINITKVIVELNSLCMEGKCRKLKYRKDLRHPKKVFIEV